MPVEHLTGSGEARGEGTGAISGPAHLAGSGAATAHGSTTLLTRLLRMPESDGAAEAGGTGVLHFDQPLTGSGTAQAVGYGWLTSPPVEGAANDIEDAWFYGATVRKSMLGTGEARGGGSGEL